MTFSDVGSVVNRKDNYISLERIFSVKYIFHRLRISNENQ